MTRLEYKVVIFRGQPSDADVRGFNALVELSNPNAEPLTRVEIGEVMRKGDILVARDPAERIIGMVTLLSIPSLTSGSNGQLQDIVVLRTAERSGVEKTLITAAMALARQRGLTRVFHTQFDSDRSGFSNVLAKLGWLPLPSVTSAILSPGRREPSRAEANRIRL